MTYLQLWIGAALLVAISCGVMAILGARYSRFAVNARTSAEMHREVNREVEDMLVVGRALEKRLQWTSPRRWDDDGMPSYFGMRLDPDEMPFAMTLERPEIRPFPDTSARPTEYDFRTRLFSRDGTRILVLSIDKTTARVWDVSTKEPIGKPMTHGDIVESAEFSPDGTRALTTGSNIMNLWDVSTGDLVSSKWASKAEFTPDGRQVTTTSFGTVRQWDAASGEPLSLPDDKRAPIGQPRDQ